MPIDERIGIKLVLHMQPLHTLETIINRITRLFLINLHALDYYMTACIE